MRNSIYFIQVYALLDYMYNQKINKTKRFLIRHICNLILY